MNPNSLHTKLKQASIHRLILETRGQPTRQDFHRLGQALDRRFKIVDGLLLAVKRGAITAECATGLISGLVVIRQIEDELALYQDELEALSGQLQAGEIDQAEFESRLEAITAAILILAFLSGQGEGNEALRQSALAALESGGSVAPDTDLSGLPAEAAEQLQAEIEIAIEAGGGLAADIATGRYEDNEGGLFSRLSMWSTTAAGVYALGQMFKADREIRLEWLRGPTRQPCKDCQGLNGQVHTVAQWQEFFIRTKKRPGSRDLACGGWNCLCGLVETDKAISGDFI